MHSMSILNGLCAAFLQYELTFHPFAVDLHISREVRDPFEELGLDGLQTHWGAVRLILLPGHRLLLGVGRQVCQGVGHEWLELLRRVHITERETTGFTTDYYGYLW